MKIFGQKLKRSSIFLVCIVYLRGGLIKKKFIDRQYKSRSVHNEKSNNSTF